MSGARIRLSVVVPTHDRREALLRTLDALAWQQRVDLAELEVVVVADGCSDGTAEAIRERAWPFALQLVEQPGLGAAAARNRGATAAVAPLLLFLDDDVVPSSGLVAAHLASHRAGGDLVALGPYPPVLPGPVSFYRTLVREWWADHFHAMEEPGHRFTYRDLVTGNLSLPAELFARVGRFDESIRGAGGEDWELGIRLLEAGAQFVFVPGAVADHYEESDLDRSLRRAQQEGLADVIMGCRHPACRTALPLAEVVTDRDPVKRSLRWIAFHTPRAGDVAARGLRRLLDPLETARLRRLWRRIMGGVRYYWYWRGVADTMGTATAAAAFVAAGRPRGRETLRIDLAHGLAVAEAQLDRERPRAVRLCFGPVPVGSIDDLPAAEPLRGAHLRPIVARRFARELGTALALERLGALRGAPHAH